MSSKSKFRGAKSDKISLPKTPRSLAEIQAEYGQVVSQAGQVQYQLFVFEREQQQLNAKLLELNQEGAARNQLDKDQAAKSEEKKEA